MCPHQRQFPLQGYYEFSDIVMIVSVCIILKTNADFGEPQQTEVSAPTQKIMCGFAQSGIVFLFNSGKQSR